MALANCIYFYLTRTMCDHVGCPTRQLIEERTKLEKASLALNLKRQPTPIELMTSMRKFNNSVSGQAAYDENIRSCMGVKERRRN